MSLGWRKFSFFERDEQRTGELPENLVASCSTNTDTCILTSSGEIVTLDRSFVELYRFQAHQQKASHIAAIQDQNLVVTVGCDTSWNVKVWREESLGRKSKDPILLRSIEVFAARNSKLSVTQFALHCQWPHILYAVGLSDGQILLLKADTGKEKVQRTELLAKLPDADLQQVSGLAFSESLGETGGPLTLFAETLSQTFAFNLDIVPPKMSVLDEMGSQSNSTTLNHDRNFVAARPEAVYLYTADGRGPCFVFDGKKQHVGWIRHYLVTVTSKLMPGSSITSITLQIIDLRNKLIALSLPLTEEPQHVLQAFGEVVLVQQDCSILCFKERPLPKKLDLLFNKSLYLVALSLANSEKADDSVVAGIQRRYADHLYGKHDYDAAMTHYLATIRHLEPSFVIRKFLDAQRIHNLTSYLEALHAEDLASVDHTTLLLNCYAKLKDVTKLDDFLKASGAAEEKPSLRFDVDTAIKVCRSAGYYEHALYVAHAAELPQIYLDILIEDCKAWNEALAYLQALPRKDSAAALQKYGKLLVTEQPEATTALLMQLCTAGSAEDWVAQVANFTHLYDERPQALMLLCEYILNSSPNPPSEETLYNTLLQLYLADEAGQGAENDDESALTVSPQARREQALELLKRGWQPGEVPRYNPDETLVLCQTHSFGEGLKFLYEKLRLFREVLRVYMAAGDSSGLIEACMRLGDASKGGDPQLWTLVLEHLTQRETDVSQQIQEVLSHIEAGGLLPPLVILQILARNPRLKLSLVKDFMARQLEAESLHIKADREQIAKYEAETKAMRQEIHELKTQARVFQNSKCAVSGAPLELPAVHFLCGHSCNVRSLGENDRECPICAPQFRTILEIRRSLKAGANEQDKFFSQLRNSADGFNVIAEFFGRGLLNNSTRI